MTEDWEDRIARRVELAKIASLPLAQRRAAEQALARRFDAPFLADAKKRAEATRRRPKTPIEEVPF